MSVGKDTQPARALRSKNFKKLWHRPQAKCNKGVRISLRLGMVLSTAIGEIHKMFTLGKIATCATLGTFVVLGGFGLPARAEGPIQNRGPVKAHEPIVTTFGNKGVIAFYEPDGAHCGLYAVVYNLVDDSGASAAQVRLSLSAGQIVSLDSPDNESLSLQCGDSAETLKVVDSKTATTNWPQR
jgi:hypothetical protein